MHASGTWSTFCIFSGSISWEMIYEAETKCNCSRQALCYCLTHSRPALGNLLVLRRIVKESRAEKHQVYANLFRNSESYNFLLEKERHQFRNICSFLFLLQRASGGLWCTPLVQFTACWWISFLKTRVELVELCRAASFQTNPVGT
jgi:hypothetical protein